MYVSMMLMTPSKPSNYRTAVELSVEGAVQGIIEPLWHVYSERFAEGHSFYGTALYVFPSFIYVDLLKRVWGFK